MRRLIAFVLLISSAASHAVVVLQYHHVSDETPASTSTSPQRFAAHLDYIEKTGYEVVSILDLKYWLERGNTLPDRKVVITFDDGYRSVYEEAYPRLRARGWPFTVFVNSQAHDNRNPLHMTWTELKAMADNGAVIANHTDSHPHLIRPRAKENHADWQARRRREISFAEQRIADEIGRAHRLFAYPFGEYDQALQQMLKEMGYLAFGQQSGPVGTYSHRQALPRFPFGGVYGDIEDFASKLTSLPFPAAKVQVTGKRGKVIEDPELPQSLSTPTLRVASPLLGHINALPTCYASGQGKIISEIKGSVLVARAERPLPIGRSRYNCTLHAGGGRYYWHSQLFIRRAPDGSWAHE